MASSPRIDWAKLLRRTFSSDVRQCPKCHGRIRVLGSVEDPTLAHYILEQLGVPTTQARPARARDPTTLDATQEDAA